MKHIAAIVAALLAGIMAGIIVLGSSTGAPGDTWHVTFTGEGGGQHAFDATADNATAARDQYWTHVTNLKVVQTNVTTSTSTTTSTTTVPTAGYPALTGPFRFDGDFDAGCSLLSGEGGDWAVDESSGGSVTIDRTTVGEGTCSAKSTTPAGGGTGRAELQMPTLSTPVTVDYEQLIYIPSEANNGPHHGYLSQTKQNNNPCSNGGLALDKADRHLKWSTAPSCAAGTTKWDLGPVEQCLDHWCAIHTIERFSDSGSLKVWLDPDGTGPAGYELKQDKPSLDTLSGTGVKLRQGRYGDNVSHVQTVFIDGFHALTP